MEKIGLFDLIDKLASRETPRKNFADDAPKKDEKNREDFYGGLKDPDFGIQPQYGANAKMRSFLKRHDALKTKIGRSQSDEK